MPKRATVLVIVSIVVVAILALVGVGLGYGWTIRENPLSAGSALDHMSPNHHENYSEYMWSHMNSTENMFDQFSDMHDSLPSS